MNRSEKLARLALVVAGVLAAIVMFRRAIHDGPEALIGFHWSLLPIALVFFFLRGRKSDLEWERTLYGRTQTTSTSSWLLPLCVMLGMVVGILGIVDALVLIVLERLWSDHRAERILDGRDGG